MGFSSQEYWSGLPFLPPGDVPKPGTEPTSPALQADSLLSELPGIPPPTPTKFMSFPGTSKRELKWEQGHSRCKGFGGGRPGVGWPFIQSNCGPQKKGRGPWTWTDTRRERATCPQRWRQMPSVASTGQGTPRAAGNTRSCEKGLQQTLPPLQRDHGPAESLVLASGLWSHERINSCCLSYPVWATSSRLPPRN